MIQNWKRCAAAGLAAVLLCQTLPAFASSAEDYEAQMDGIDQEISEIEQQQEENAAEADRLNADLDRLRGEKEEAEEYQRLLEEKIENYETRIDLARERIAELNGNILELEKEIRQADLDYADTLEKLKERLRALYISGGELTTLQILLDSTSLYDYALRSEAVKSVSRHDSELMDEIKEYMRITQDKREAVSKQKDEVGEQKKGLEATQKELQALEKENAALIEELNLKTKETEDALAEKAAEKAAYDAYIQELIAEQNELMRQEEERRRQEEAGLTGENGETGSGDASMLNTGELSFMWPLPGYGREAITQHFGEYYGGEAHNGLDIGAPYGTPIVAAEAGKVVSAEYHDSWGNNVLIWHNGTYSTRYAHMSSMAVSAGTYVSKGQVIGYVGSTGYSDGNHLHFEVYVNGSRVNPEGYV